MCVESCWIVSRNTSVFVHCCRYLHGLMVLLHAVSDYHGSQWWKEPSQIKIKTLQVYFSFTWPDFLFQGFFGKGILSRARPDHSISEKWEGESSPAWWDHHWYGLPTQFCALSWFVCCLTELEDLYLPVVSQARSVASHSVCLVDDITSCLTFQPFTGTKNYLGGQRQVFLLRDCLQRLWIKPFTN